MVPLDFQSEERLRLFDQVFTAHFLSRPNRFLVRCTLEGRIVSAFLPNPGRLHELLLPGRPIYLIRQGDRSLRNRKTLFTAVAVKREEFPILLHTHLTNQVAQYLLERGKIPGLERARIARQEIQIGRNRFDFLLEEKGRNILLEVKSCTLVGEEVAMFPDAVTERGARHLEALARLKEMGMEGAVLFIVHWPLAEVFMPDYHTDLNFARIFLEIKEKVRAIAVSVKWEEDLSMTPNVRPLHIPWEYIDREAKDRGSYVLILEMRRGRNLSVGRLGRVPLRKGFYVYVGSAMTRLSKRMERHRRMRKRHHWHIDALRAVASFHAAFAIRSSKRMECEVSEAFSKICEWTISGFGCSDCSCSTHLFGFGDDPLHSENFHRLLQSFRMNRYAGEQA